MSNVLVTVVDVTVVFRQQIDIVKDKTIKHVLPQRLQHSGVVQAAFVKQPAASLQHNVSVDLQHNHNNNNIFTDILADSHLDATSGEAGSAANSTTNSKTSPPTTSSHFQRAEAILTRLAVI